MNKTNSYNCLLWKRGFLLTDVEPNFRNKIEQSIIDSWQQEIIGSYTLYYDKDLTLTRSKSVLILGLVINPVENINDPKIIAATLQHKYGVSDFSFFDYVDQLSGRFLVIVQDNTNLKLLQDAGGTRSVFYDRSSAASIIASHSSLIAALGNYSLSEKAKWFMAQRKVTKYLPGLLSPYEEIYQLTPNTLLNCNNKNVERFFPRDSLTECQDFNTLIEDLSTLFTRQVNLLKDNYKIAVSLTAGLDSRLTFAATASVTEDTLYFSYINSNNPNPGDAIDVKVADALCKKFNLPYQIFDFSPTQWQEDDLNSFRNIWKRNLGWSQRGMMNLNKAYVETYPGDRLHIRSNLAEIGRVFWNTRSETSIKTSELAKKYAAKNQDHPEILKAFDEYISVTSFTDKSIYNYDFYDLFYWEHRMSSWHSLIVTENDISHDTFILYNNREILKKLLSLPYEDRLVAKAFYAVIDKLLPRSS